MSIFTISEQKEKALAERMEKLGVKEADFRETFVRSSGPGGQKVNKTSSCVFLVHVPTGLSVKCQRERSQSLNRFIARRLLLDKIERKEKGIADAEKERREKIRRQKRKRTQRTKEKMLKLKHMRSETKARRSPVSTRNLDE